MTQKCPSRAKMCSWLSGALLNLSGVMPYNPADIARLTRNALNTDKRLRKLSVIAAELGWHVDADLELAWELIQQYDLENPNEEES